MARSYLKKKKKILEARIADEAAWFVAVRTILELGMVAHICNPSTWEAKIGGLRVW
jgi:hypothetical protein